MKNHCVLCGTDLGPKYAGEMIEVDGFTVHEPCNDWFHNLRQNANNVTKSGTSDFPEG